MNPPSNNAVLVTAARWRIEMNQKGLVYAVAQPRIEA
jgi:hypothetical protein